MPRIAPLRKTFSRPVSSGWKPVPTSSRLPTRPRMTARPARRCRDPRQELQKRRLPGAVAADDAEDLAPLDLEGHVLERPDLLLVRPVFLPHQAPSGVRQANRGASRNPDWSWPMRYCLESPSTSMVAVDIRSCPQNAAPRSRKYREPGHEQSTPGRHADYHHARARSRTPEQRPAEAGDHGGHRVEREQPLIPLLERGHRVDDGREVHPDVDHERNRDWNVSIADVPDREDQADAERRAGGEQQEEGSEERLNTQREVEPEDHPHEHGKCDEEVDEWGGDRAERQQQRGK